MAVTGGQVLPHPTCLYLSVTEQQVNSSQVMFGDCITIIFYNCFYWSLFEICESEVIDHVGAIPLLSHLIHTVLKSVINLPVWSHIFSWGICRPQRKNRLLWARQWVVSILVGCHTTMALGWYMPGYDRKCNMGHRTSSRAALGGLPVILSV